MPDKSTSPRSTPEDRAVGIFDIVWTVTPGDPRA